MTTTVSPHHSIDAYSEMRFLGKWHMGLGALSIITSGVFCFYANSPALSIAAGCQGIGGVVIGIIGHNQYKMADKIEKSYTHNQLIIDRIFSQKAWCCTTATTSNPAKLYSDKV